MSYGYRTFAMSSNDATPRGPTRSRAVNPVLRPSPDPASPSPSAVSSTHSGHNYLYNSPLQQPRPSTSAATGALPVHEFPDGPLFVHEWHTTHLAALLGQAMDQRVSAQELELRVRNLHVSRLGWYSRNIPDANRIRSGGAGATSSSSNVHTPSVYTTPSRHRHHFLVAEVSLRDGNGVSDDGSAVLDGGPRAVGRSRVVGHLRIEGTCNPDLVIDSVLPVLDQPPVAIRPVALSSTTGSRYHHQTTTRHHSSRSPSASSDSVFNLGKEDFDGGDFEGGKENLFGGGDWRPKGRTMSPPSSPLFISPFASRANSVGPSSRGLTQFVVNTHSNPPSSLQGTRGAESGDARCVLELAVDANPDRRVRKPVSVDGGHANEDSKGAGLAARFERDRRRFEKDFSSVLSLGSVNKQSRAHRAGGVID
ncbi:hypothetical protein FA15DRAFT_493794 [Coprinopsis marcescibilis]|uniref:Uncharacterized protein n=1 Tax=Coprinopsis marcescibilis TaxID=230819 RepID=A0A5C3L4A7_COPMA|nr:hypothetical protein FA15DRAFT_493794 [Coprinopsis marcescibilis]